MKSKKEQKARIVRTNICLGKSIIPVYAGQKVANAFKEISMDMDLFHGVKLIQFLEAVYDRGVKGGRRKVFERIEEVRKIVLIGLAKLCGKKKNGN